MEKETILSLLTIILACFSCISCICVCTSIYNKGYRPCKCKEKNNNMDEYLVQINALKRKKKEQLNQANIILFWMCIVDGFHMLPIIANWIPQIIANNDEYWNNTQCTIIGVIAQFCGLQGASWHILLAYYLGYILCGGDLQEKIKKMYKQRYIYYILVTIIPLIGTIIPFFMDTQNGYNMNVLDGDKDCWVIGYSQYIFIITITITLIFHYSVLLIAFIQFKKSNYQKYQIIAKLSKFVIVYTIIRFFPLIERIYEISEDVPFWLVLLQHLSIASLGIGNALVWFWNSNQFKNTNKSDKITKIKKEIKKSNVDLSVVYSINTATPIHTNTSNVIIDDQYNILQASDLRSNQQNIYSMKHEIHDIQDW